MARIDDLKIKIKANKKQMELAVKETNALIEELKLVEKQENEATKKSNEYAKWYSDSFTVESNSLNNYLKSKNSMIEAILSEEKRSTIAEVLASIDKKIEVAGEDISKAQVSLDIAQKELSKAQEALEKDNSDLDALNGLKSSLELELKGLQKLKDQIEKYESMQKFPVVYGLLLLMKEGHNALIIKDAASYNKALADLLNNILEKKKSINDKQNEVNKKKQVVIEAKAKLDTLRTKRNENILQELT